MERAKPLQGLSAHVVMAPLAPAALARGELAESLMWSSTPVSLWPAAQRTASCRTASVGGLCSVSGTDQSVWADAFGLVIDTEVVERVATEVETVRRVSSMDKPSKTQASGLGQMLMRLHNLEADKSSLAARYSQHMASE